MNKKITKKLLALIPGGAHTYSRGFDQFPENAPEILKRGKGVYIYDNNGKKLLDYGMGLRSVNIGYAEKKINQAAFRQINYGNNLTRPSVVELEAAKTLVKTIDSVDMVKFTKNGSTAVTAAVKLARAYNGKKIILRCIDHPFFSYDDWFIGSTVITKGIPNEVSKLTDTFFYNNINSLKKKIIEYKNKISCVVLEPAATECPKIEGLFGCCGKKVCERNFFNKKHFLKEVEQICKNNKIVFILDEMITGFRWSIKGAQYLYNIDPDISTFGKAMANGFSVAAVCGKKKYMELGSIEKKNNERVFLLSTTHGAEMSGLGAFIETVSFLKKNKVIKKNWEYGGNLINKANEIAKSLGVDKYFYFAGAACSPYYICKDKIGQVSFEFKTLFMQEMIKNRVLMPWVSIAYRHNQQEFNLTLLALEKSLYTYKKALYYGIKKYLVGPAIKPVFRKFN
jgi:glutamate-1-semialdehyde 2,1-aminomutase